MTLNNFQSLFNCCYSKSLSVERTRDMFAISFFVILNLLLSYSVIQSKVWNKNQCQCQCQQKQNCSYKLAVSIRYQRFAASLTAINDDMHTRRAGGQLGAPGHAGAVEDVLERVAMIAVIARNIGVQRRVCRHVVLDAAVARCH